MIVLDSCLAPFNQDNSGLKVDAIVGQRDGSWGAIAVKLGYHHEEETAAASLVRLKAKMENGGEKPPAFLAIIVGVGGLARVRKDGVLVIPADRLCP